MKPGSLNFFILIVTLITYAYFASAENKIETVPLINLDELSPTFEEDKIELEALEEKKSSLKKSLEDQNSKKISSTFKFITGS